MSVVFYNPGHVDVRAFTTFGINAKQNNSAIGYFGTGLKYAIAVLLREGCAVHADIGGRIIEFRKASGEFRDKQFDFVEMIENDKVTQLPFTLELGKNWKLWMAYRELYSNAIDENGGVASADDIYPTNDNTYIVVKGPEIEKVHNERSTWFIQDNRRKFVETPEVDVYEGQSSVVFNKGICVRDDLGKPSMFTYNVKSKMTLSEDRRAQYLWEYERAVSCCIATSDNEDFIRRVLSAPELSYEYGFDWDIGISPGPTFMRVFEELTHESVRNVRIAARKYVMRHTGKDTISVENIVDIDDFEKLMLDKAKDFVTSLGLDMTKYPLHVVKDKEEICGLADMEKKAMYINKDTFRRGTVWVAATLFEEYTHLDTGYHDETYDLQTHYLLKLLDYAQRWKGVVL